MSTQAREMKTKINKWYQFKLKSFCTEKETNSKTKGQLSKWGKKKYLQTTYLLRGYYPKIQRTHINQHQKKKTRIWNSRAAQWLRIWPYHHSCLGSVIGLEASVCHGHSQKQNKTKTTPPFPINQTKQTKKNLIFKKAEDLKRFFQRGQMDGQQIHKKCLASLIIWEIQIKNTVRYYFRQPDPSDRLLSKRQEIASVGEDVEKREPLCTAGGSVNWCSCNGKQCGSC